MNGKKKGVKGSRIPTIVIGGPSAGFEGSSGKSVRRISDIEYRINNIGDRSSKSDIRYSDFERPGTRGIILNIKQFRYSSDNLGYLLYAEKSAIAIDGGAVDQIFSFAGQNGLKIEYVTNTHSHPDHTMGLKSLLGKSGAVYLDHSTLPAKGFIGLAGEKIDVYHTPGHTDDSVTFHAGNFLITGDTLFNGTVGNCFSGDLLAFYNSIKRLIAFPKDTVIYAGHDYVEYSMSFARLIEPGNGDIDTFLKKYNPEHVFSKLEDELRVNPYLRFNDSKMISVLKERGLPVSTEFERWESLMSLG